MDDNFSDIDINVAAILHDIAANADDVTGKILRSADKAAKKGLSSLKIKVSEGDYKYVDDLRWAHRAGQSKSTPLIEKLCSLGFTVSDPDKEMKWWCTDYNYFIMIRW